MLVPDASLPPDGFPPGVRTLPEQASARAALAALVVRTRAAGVAGLTALP